jgi:hypothetical protein
VRLLNVEEGIAENFDEYLHIHSFKFDENTRKSDLIILHLDSKFMGKSSPWGANSRLTGHSSLFFLWNPKVHYCIHKIQTFVFNLGQTNPMHIITQYLYRRRIILYKLTVAQLVKNFLIFWAKPESLWY